MDIGGYFELELINGKHYHPEAFRFNSGRNAFQYILQTQKYENVYLPYFTCVSIIESALKIGINVKFYRINEDFEPIFDFKKVRKNEVFVYINYFGLFDHVGSKLVDQCSNLIIDNSQAFFSKPFPGIDTFYSPRKFFGVPDGAYLYTSKVLSAQVEKLPVSKSAYRFGHLLKRIEAGAEAGYDLFRKNNKRLAGQQIKQMSVLTTKLLEGIDYQFVAERRRANFTFIEQALRRKNKIEIGLSENSVPMVYPFMADSAGLKSQLIKSKIYVATYWPEVIKTCKPSTLENKLANNILSLPVDQRYGEKEMEFILEILEVLS
jgi:hypothetical protein